MYVQTNKQHESKIAYLEAELDAKTKVGLVHCVRCCSCGWQQESGQGWLHRR